MSERIRVREVSNLPEHPDVSTFGTKGPWWIAHEHPERPPDAWTVWCWSCDPCMLHLIASSIRYPMGRSLEYDGDTEERVADLAATLTTARQWRFRNGYRPL